ncbi:MAG: hypothetical protein FJ184_10175 [Gammaproteobacteria bacterium]|nr:hypothetical protein [Gammaproteobacteria bacterium]
MAIRDNQVFTHKKPLPLPAGASGGESTGGGRFSFLSGDVGGFSLCFGSKEGEISRAKSSHCNPVILSFSAISSEIEALCADDNDPQACAAEGLIQKNHEA